MQRSRVHVLLVALGALTSGAVVANGCSAGRDSGGTNGLGGGDGFGGGKPGSGGHHQGSGAGGAGGGLIIHDGGKDAPDDVMMNPCGTQCGATELCDDAHLGLDDNCDGQADEGCPCTPGQAHFCFKGDASYRGTPGCFDGVEKCTEMGTWGPCVGGKHATPQDKCYAADLQGCHSLSAPPFATVDLKSGTGTFSGDADPGSESWNVVCPAGVNPCPTPSGTPAENYTPLQSGEYQVTYHKTVSGTAKSCDYSLFVGAPGVRVELTWEHNLGGTGVDLDLHMHEPLNTDVWAVDGVEQDCGWLNCKANSFNPSSPSSDAPHWFPDTNTPPAPVNWDKDPDPMKNTCYYAPNGHGATWQGYDNGCHNPRLDTDNITCAPGVTNPSASNFCAPENINIDFPPTDEWMRIGVHYFSNHGYTYNIHPEIKVYCDGALVSDLGPLGYDAPVTFTPAMGSSPRQIWLVGDVKYTPGSQCVPSQCVVQPLFQDSGAMTPFFEADDSSGNSGYPAFGPPYPP